MATDLKNIGGVAQTAAQQPLTTGRAHSTHENKMEKAATDFEALLLQQMFQTMWSTAPSAGMVSGSHEEELYRGMLTEELAKSVSENQSLGVKDMLVKDMKRIDGKMNPYEKK